MRGLTAVQESTLVYMIDHFRQTGTWPTIRKIGQALGVHSTNGVGCRLRGLQRKGYVAQGEPGTRSCWRATRGIDGQQILPALQSTGPTLPVDDGDRTVEVKIYGQVRR